MFAAVAEISGGGRGNKATPGCRESCARRKLREHGIDVAMAAYPMYRATKTCPDGIYALSLCHDAGNVIPSRLRVPRNERRTQDHCSTYVEWKTKHKKVKYVHRAD